VARLLREARVLIAGAGYVGTRLGERLVAEGAEVFALRRRPRDLPAGVHVIAADLFDASTLDELPSGLDFVVYSVSPDAHDEAAYERAYLLGLKNLLRSKALGESASSRVIFTSSTAVYGQTDGSWVDETSETLPESFAGRCLLAAESWLTEFGRPRVIVRFGGIYGPNRDRLLRQVLAGEARYPKEPTFTNRIHREDSAGALMHFMALPEPEPLYVGVDHEPAEIRVVQQFVARATGSPAPTPEEAKGRSRGGNKRCSSLRLRQSGYAFAFPSFREGYGDLIRSMGV
jgi:nucleoside-diphosphate-sugar epimerase